MTYSRFITCSHCNETFEVTNVRSQNVKYCSKKCWRKADYAKHRVERTAANHAKYDKPWVGKMQCVICGWWYKRVCSHVHLRHGVDEKEYKDFLGLDRGKGLVSEAFSAHMRELALHYEMDKQLKKAGQATRWSKDSPPPKYDRSPETIARLKELWKTQKNTKVGKKKLQK